MLQPNPESPLNLDLITATENLRLCCPPLGALYIRKRLLHVTPRPGSLSLFDLASKSLPAVGHHSRAVTWATPIGLDASDSSLSHQLVLIQASMKSTPHDRREEDVTTNLVDFCRPPPASQSSWINSHDDGDDLRLSLITSPWVGFKFRFFKASFEPCFQTAPPPPSAGPGLTPLVILAGEQKCRQFHAFLAANLALPGCLVMLALPPIVFQLITSSPPPAVAQSSACSALLRRADAFDLMSGPIAMIGARGG